MCRVDVRMAWWAADVGQRRMKPPKIQKGTKYEHTQTRTPHGFMETLGFLFLSLFPCRWLPWGAMWKREARCTHHSLSARAQLDIQHAKVSHLGF